MKFDVKDVKSWANRHDVKVGDEGYVAYSISDFRGLNIDDAECGKVIYIDDDSNLCFKSDLDPFTDYAFFLPLKAVKKEKEYRPFKNLYEFYKFLTIAPFAKEDFRREMLLKFCFTYREKSLPQIATSVVITRIDVGLDNDPYSTCINNKDFEGWFDNYEIMNSKGEWLPFGVEVKEDD